ncbi:Cytochrome P450 monooxygenase TRI13 [Colletotrichum shisoi]|uniref:Cytochrome P450 monooxygenase TRI13 n=1 Tax=Colletotrichum shisoi TaxID=2078593 RepID=A0A5Q4BD35_9PEZI|nr:Cytochrome P450 monooxygenase TRI13 [Colletotrichum shisoi]
MAVALYALYQYLLPKPIAGIPYNPAATQSMLGDIPAMLKNPLFQLFITPFSKPIVVVTDFREAQDLLMRRKEFDRSDFSIALLGGESPNFHINLKSGQEWKSHQRLLQDLMTPRFLSGVAVPNIYQSATKLIDLLKQKARVADGRPFSAEKDIYFAALDAVLDSGFGTPVDFLVARPHESIEATLAIGDLVQDVADSGFVKLAWWSKGFQPHERKLRNMRAEFLREQASHAVEKLQRESDEENESCVKCAVDLVVQRERSFAKKEGCEPVYWSLAMKDEDAHAEALVEKRAPTHDEITKAKIPYLDAVIEEILRLGHNVPVVDRQCTQDTVILGHHIPEGTHVFSPNFGPSFTSPPTEIDEALRGETSQLAAKERGIRSWPVNDMEVFRPERWLMQDEQTSNEVYNATAGPTIPFGLGPRSCFGRKLAYLELRLLISLII